MRILEGWTGREPLLFYLGLMGALWTGLWYSEGRRKSPPPPEPPPAAAPAPVSTYLRLDEMRAVPGAQQEARAERDREWKEAILRYVGHYGDLVEDCDDCKSLRALLEGK